ncbi:SDR family NAD(P)-dependent oxidoreductase [Martelella mediterranea]|uniref:NAD(P)-dependent dehydrogenase (Short-subunit alcohol dehydrogenase family) n=1 Tax=Martelella mediterranea TaxID=293089 RepID=A0A4R3NU12_9HYPH|nr:SDR family NAD(P)-dependent oxidoreductase [Martelella mediterranea]TCT39083.1 NAD(P)-dependent dehydrogenase (short-subunit alcohol dehydrogenase family) [Martelella mediterranea]
MAKRFENKTIIVTGGASGIGAACAHLLAKEGANVVVADLNQKHADKTVAEISQAGGNAAAFAVDVGDPKAVESMVQFAIDRFGGLYGAVNNAGIGGPALPIGDYEIEDWHKVLNVDLHSVFYCMKYELAAMEKFGGGSIVNMSSILGTNGFSTAPAYVASKHAVIGMTKSAALEYSKRGIRINAVGPGFIRTPLLDENMEQDDIDALAELHPVGRLGKPEEVAALTAFLLAEESSFVTGSYHLVDGAYSAQ